MLKLPKPGLLAGLLPGVAAGCLFVWVTFSSLEFSGRKQSSPSTVLPHTGEGNAAKLEFARSSVMSTVEKLLTERQGFKAGVLLLSATNSDVQSQERIAACLDYVSTNNKQYLLDILVQLGSVSPDFTAEQPAASTLLANLNSIANLEGIEAAQRRGHLIYGLARIDADLALSWTLQSPPKHEQGRLLGAAFLALRQTKQDWGEKIAQFLIANEGCRIQWPASFSITDFAHLASAFNGRFGSSEQYWSRLGQMTTPEMVSRIESTRNILKATSAQEVARIMKHDNGLKNEAIVAWLRYNYDGNPSAMGEEIKKAARTNNDATGSMLFELLRQNGGDVTMGELLSSGVLPKRDMELAVRVLTEGQDPANRVKAVEDLAAKYPVAKDAAYMALSLLGENTDQRMEAASKISDAALKRNALANTLSRMTDEDPLTAMKLASELSMTNNWKKETLIAPAFDTWMASDPYTASSWFASQEKMDEATKSALLEKVILRTIPHDPSAALAWIETIQDPDVKERYSRILIASLPSETPPKDTEP